MRPQGNPPSVPDALMEQLPVQRERDEAPTTPRVAPSGGTAWGRKALEELCADLARKREGDNRNDGLNYAAWRCGRLVAGGQLEEAQARDALADAARACGLESSEIPKTIDSGMRTGMSEPVAPSKTPTPTSNGAAHVTEVVASDGFSLVPVDLRVFLATTPPAVEYLIEPYIPKGRRVWGFGAASSAKSMWAAWAAARLSRDSHKVVYISEENPLDEDHRRLHRLRPDPDYFTFISNSGIDLALADHAAALIEVSKDAVLIVLDTLSAVWSGKEDDNRAVADLDLAVLKPLVGHGASVLVLHHTGHPQAFVSRKGVSAGRGASSMGQKADVTLNFAAKGNSEFTIEMS
jgi:hypothetical protein